LPYFVFFLSLHQDGISPLHTFYSLPPFSSVNHFICPVSLTEFV
jgi:hypothetical protein